MHSTLKQPVAPIYLEAFPREILKRILGNVRPNSIESLSLVFTGSSWLRRLLEIYGLSSVKLSCMKLADTSRMLSDMFREGMLPMSADGQILMKTFAEVLFTKSLRILVSTVLISKCVKDSDISMLHTISRYIRQLGEPISYYHMRCVNPLSTVDSVIATLCKYSTLPFIKAFLSYWNLLETHPSCEVFVGLAVMYERLDLLKMYCDTQPQNARDTLISAIPTMSVDMFDNMFTVSIHHEPCFSHTTLAGRIAVNVLVFRNNVSLARKLIEIGLLSPKEILACIETSVEGDCYEMLDYILTDILVQCNDDVDSMSAFRTFIGRDSFASRIMERGWISITMLRRLLEFTGMYDPEGRMIFDDELSNAILSRVTVINAYREEEVADYEWLIENFILCHKRQYDPLALCTAFDQLTNKAASGLSAVTYKLALQITCFKALFLSLCKQNRIDICTQILEPYFNGVRNELLPLINHDVLNTCFSDVMRGSPSETFNGQANVMAQFLLYHSGGKLSIPLCHELFLYLASNGQVEKVIWMNLQNISPPVTGEMMFNALKAALMNGHISVAEVICNMGMLCVIQKSAEKQQALLKCVLETGCKHRSLDFMIQHIGIDCSDLETLQCLSGRIILFKGFELSFVEHCLMTLLETYGVYYAKQSIDYIGQLLESVLKCYIRLECSSILTALLNVFRNVDFQSTAHLMILRTACKLSYATQSIHMPSSPSGIIYGNFEKQAPSATKFLLSLVMSIERSSSKSSGGKSIRRLVADDFHDDTAPLIKNTDSLAHWRKLKCTLASAWYVMYRYTAL